MISYIKIFSNIYNKYFYVSIILLMKIIFAYNGPFWTLDNIVFLNNILKKNFSTITIDNKSYELSFDIYNFSLNLGIIEGKEEKNFFNDLNKLPDIYDGIIFANIINHTPFIKIWYDVVINFLKKNKFIIKKVKKYTGFDNNIYIAKKL